MDELIAEAMLGPSTTECNWLLITIDTARFRDGHALQSAAEEALSELRDCPPASGFERVEIPGGREREHRRQSNGIIAAPERTWSEICQLQDEQQGPLPSSAASQHLIVSGPAHGPLDGQCFLPERQGRDLASTNSPVTSAHGDRLAGTPEMSIDQREANIPRQAR